MRTGISRGSGERPAIAFIRARWHAEIVDASLEGFLEETAALDLHAQVDTFDVPGAFEMPLLARRLGSSGRYDAVVAAAFIVDGGIYRHEFVAQTVIHGLMQAQFETDVPVYSLSLTPHHFQPTPTHREFFTGHFRLKGAETARAVSAMLDLGAEFD